MKCLVWTKALVNEAIRLCVPGWPFGCLRYATKDGHLNEYDFCEGDLILFNRPAYHCNGELWSPRLDSDSKFKTDDYSSDLFNPARFVKSNFDAAELEIPIHWARIILNGYIVCIPNKFIYTVVTALIVHLLGSGWKVTDFESRDATLDTPVQWSSSILAQLSLINITYEKD